MLVLTSETLLPMIMTMMNVSNHLWSTSLFAKQRSVHHLRPAAVLNTASQQAYLQRQLVGQQSCGYMTGITGTSVTTSTANMSHNRQQIQFNLSAICVNKCILFQQLWGLSDTIFYRHEMFPVTPCAFSWVRV